MRMILLPSLFVITCTLNAQTGPISGTVTNSAGEAISKATVILRDTSRNLSKSINTDQKGKFFQIGMQPYIYEVTVKAEGYQSSVKQVKIDFQFEVVANFTLYRLDEKRPREDNAIVYSSSAVRDPSNEAFAMQDDSPVANTTDPTLRLDAESRELFNKAIPFYQEKKYNEAVPLMAKAYQGMSLAMESTKDEEIKKEISELLVKVKKAYAISLYYSKNSEALPLLIEIANSNPSNKLNGDIFSILVEYYESVKDDSNSSKYRDYLESVVGPKPELTYNVAVTAFNQGDLIVARANVLKAIQIGPNFADSYWLLGMIDYANGNIPSAKNNFRKYLSLDPNGKYAKDIKQELNNM